MRRVHGELEDAWSRAECRSHGERRLGLRYGGVVLREECCYRIRGRRHLRVAVAHLVHLAKLMVHDLGVHGRRRNDRIQPGVIHVERIMCETER